MTALRIDDVSVQLGGRSVLDRVRLDVARGELVSLVGPNGAGKTTLLRTALGLLRPAAGRVLVDERPVKPGRVRVGYVPQRHEFAFDFPIDVAGVVATGLTGSLGLWRRPNATHWKAVADALHRVRMSEYAHRPVGQLSGGQRQRVLVARALVIDPTVLLLDEPFTGLDMPTADLLATLFAEIAHEGRAVLMTTHDLIGAIDISDRIALLNRRITAVGDPRTLADDAGLWMSTFGVDAESALLRAVKAAAA
jgi:manganese/iron transport system ATP-binding protein